MPKPNTASIDAAADGVLTITLRGTVEAKRAANVLLHYWYEPLGKGRWQPKAASNPVDLATILKMNGFEVELEIASGS